MPSREICLKFFDAADCLLMGQYLSEYEWYEDLHPLLDDEDGVKAKYRVRSMIMERWDESGTYRPEARNRYSSEGVLIAADVWENDQWSADGRFIPIVPTNSAPNQPGSADFVDGEFSGDLFL